MKIIKPYNPQIQTFNETPSKEAAKAAAMVNRYIYWMLNESSLERFKDCFGSVMGTHFWNKLVEKRTKCEYTAGADCAFWIEMSNTYRPMLMNYILKTRYKG